MEPRRPHHDERDHGRRWRRHAFAPATFGRPRGIGPARGEGHGDARDRGPEPGTPGDEAERPPSAG